MGFPWILVIALIAHGSVFVGVVRAEELGSESKSSIGNGHALLEVPFLPQGRLLCGGASVAMVQRYWGAPDARAEDFEALVDAEVGGISTSALVRFVRNRGWKAFSLRADRESIRSHLSRGRPLVALLRASPGTNAFHYVVITGWMGDHLLVHDPSVGPYRLQTFEEVWEAWKASELWTLLVLPSPNMPATAPQESAPSPPAPPRREPRGCDNLVSRALASKGDLGLAGALLSVASQLCPGEPTVKRELAAVRFHQEQWRETAELAEQAVALDPSDDHAWSLLGASRYLMGDRDGSLDAWNRTGEPTLDVTSIGGLTRTRQEVVYRYLSLPPGSLLSADRLQRIRRRVEDLPTMGRTRVSFEPSGGERAKLTVAVTEGELLEPLPSLMMQSSVDAFTKRETKTVLSSPTGGGERLEAGFRWWERRPAFWVTLETPVLEWPGILRLEARIDRQDYVLSDGADPVRESRRGARVEYGTWLSSATKAELGMGFDAFVSQGQWVQLRGAVEHHFVPDRLWIRAGGERWFGDAAPFTELGATLAASITRGQTWSLRTRIDARSVSEEAPLAVWPGAGTGRARSLLLRGYPLLQDGVLVGEGFGPRLVHGTVEAERIVWTPGFARIALAPFFDWAWIATGGKRTPNESARTLSSLGVGLRVHVFGRSLRLDGATRLGDGQFVLSAGWVESW